MAAIQFRHSLGRRSLALIMPIQNTSVLKTWNYRKICVSMSSCKLCSSFPKIALLLPGFFMVPIPIAPSSLNLQCMCIPLQNCNNTFCHPPFFSPHTSQVLSWSSSAHPAAVGWQLPWLYRSQDNPSDATCLSFSHLALKDRAILLYRLWTQAQRLVAIF